MVSDGIVSFLLSSWYCAMVWIQYKKVHNSLMLGYHYIATTTSLYKWGGAPEAVREQGQDSWPELAKRLLYTSTSCPVHKSWPGGMDHCSRLGMLAGHQQLYCVSSLAYLGLFLFVVFLYGTIMFNFNSVLISTHCFYLSSYSSLHSTRAGRMRYLVTGCT